MSDSEYSSTDSHSSDSDYDDTEETITLDNLVDLLDDAQTDTKLPPLYYKNGSDKRQLATPNHTITNMTLQTFVDDVKRYCNNDTMRLYIIQLVHQQINTYRIQQGTYKSLKQLANLVHKHYITIKSTKCKKTLEELRKKEHTLEKREKDLDKQLKKIEKKQQNIQYDELKILQQNKHILQNNIIRF